MAVVRSAVRRPGSLLLAPVIALVVLIGLAPPVQASLIGQISGTVTGGGAPLVNAWVTLIPVTDFGTHTGTEKLALTDASGQYEFPEVYDGHVRILVRAPAFSGLVDTFYPDAPTFARGEVLEISSWPLIADVELPEAGSVSGNVVDLDTGAPVEGARVAALVVDDPAAGEIGLSIRTSEPGGFVVSGLPPVDLQVRVALPANSPYVNTPYEPGTSTPGVLVDGSQNTTGTVIGLKRGAQISGTVRDRAGAPIPGATVKVIGCLPDCPLLATSDSNGAYMIHAVRPAARLGVVAWRGNDHLRQWFPGRDNASLATDISVGFGDVAPDVDFALTPAAFLTVDVRGSLRDEPLRSIAMLMTVGATSTMYYSSHPVEDSDDSIRLRVGPVPPGEYELRVNPGAANPGYLPARWANGNGIRQSTVIRLKAGDDVQMSVRLPLAVTQDVPGDPLESAVPGGWPGLTQGFLAASSWADSPVVADGGKPPSAPAGCTSAESTHTT